MEHGKPAHEPYQYRVVVLIDYSLQKQQQQKDEAAAGPTQKKKKVTAAQLRVQRGMSKAIGKAFTC
jgi:hypothetical protein